MRKMRLALATLAVLVVGSGAAQALEVKKKIGVPGDTTKIWEMIGGFCSIKDWHPVIADCKETKEGDTTFRVLTLKDNGGTIKEKLDESDDSSYSYEILESPLPVKDYKAKLWIEEDDRQPDRSIVHWEAEFDANGASDEDAQKKITDVFMAGLKNIKQKAMPPEEETPAGTDKE